MNTNEIQTVVNMVSDKVGSAIDKITPLAIEVIKQYQMRALTFTFFGLFFMVLFFVFLGLCIHFLKNSKTLNEYRADFNQGLGTLFGALAVISAITGISMIFINIGNYIAPVCGLIGK